MDNRRLIGLPVYADGRQVGRVEDIRQTDAGVLNSIVIHLDDTDRHLNLSMNVVDEVAENRITIDTSNVPFAELVTDAVQFGGTVDTDDKAHLTLHEEVVSASVRPVERGVVRVRKHVETVPFQEGILVENESVNVERVPIDRYVDEAPKMREEGDTWIIPVLEEVIVTERKLRLVEEVRVTRKRETQIHEIDEELQREVIEITEDFTKPS